jgi:FkbM family methyltransferase
VGSNPTGGPIGDAMEEAHSLEFVMRHIKHYVTGDIDIVYDIGAYNGSWTKDVKKILPNANFYLFEPNIKHNEKLLSASNNVYNVLLSNEPKAVNFWQKNSTGDSYYKENTDYYNDVSPTIMQSETLDSFIEKNKIPLPDFIKIDTQGSELDIIVGAKNALSHAQIVLLECSLVEYNSGEPSFSSVVKEMMKNGFVPFYLTETHFYLEMLVQLDILFIKSLDFKKYEKFI